MPDDIERHPRMSALWRGVVAAAMDGGMTSQTIARHPRLHSFPGIPFAEEAAARVSTTVSAPGAERPSEPTTLLPEAVNYHLNKNCNFRCKGCYAVFTDDPTVRRAMLPREQMFRLVDGIAAQPLPPGRKVRKLTFAGGEPTLCPWLPELVAHARMRGLVTMVVTNGSRCSRDYLARLEPGLDWLTVSIDSLDPETNRRIGRHDSTGRPLDRLEYARILDDARAIGLRTKINTVVNRHNHGEDMSGFLLGAGIARWKVLQVMEVGGQNDAGYGALAVTRGEFDAFVARHARVEAAGVRVVPEPVESIRGSYAMIDPHGRFFDSSQGHHFYSRPILDAGVADAFAEVHFDAERFIRRGGSYDFRSLTDTAGAATTSADLPGVFNGHRQGDTEL
jgi:radical S-adenosyl methionine domain-containing protein 2